MSQQSCTACNDLREYAPEFVVNGVTDDVCENLANNQGLSAADGHEDCEDLHDVNDCLIGNMDDEVEQFEVCEWKNFMHQYIPNNYETLKAMICSMCGEWDAIECLEKKVSAVTFTPVVNAFRSGLGDVGYRKPVEGEDIGTLRIYMDAHEDDTQDSSPNGTYGSKPADRDYIAILTWCATAKDLDNKYIAVDVSVRNNSQTPAYGRARGQHYSVSGVTTISMNQSGFCYLPKGGHLLMEQHCSSNNTDDGVFRVHQISMVLIPVISNSIEC